MTVLSKATSAIGKDFILSVTGDLVSEYLREKGWYRRDEIRLDLQEFHETVLYPRFEYKVITTIDLGYRNGLKVLGKVVLECG